MFLGITIPDIVQVPHTVIHTFHKAAKPINFVLSANKYTQNFMLSRQSSFQEQSLQKVAFHQN